MDASDQFFEELGRQGHLPLMERATGTLRLDVVDGEQTKHWFVRITKGDVNVSHEEQAADCVITAERHLVEGLCSGRRNAFVAVLRGEVDIDGDPELMVLFQRLLPGPPAGGREREGATP
jgi:predicted lipid carrier protein YhbT